MSSNAKKPKKKGKVQEINGELWLVDPSGQKIKRVKRKTDGSQSKPNTGGSSSNSVGGRGGSSTSSLGSTVSSPKAKKKKQVREINGELWQIDENGNQIKKVRRKGEPPQPRKGRSGDDASSVATSNNKPRRMKSMPIQRGRSRGRSVGRSKSPGPSRGVGRSKSRGAQSRGPMSSQRSFRESDAASHFADAAASGVDIGASSSLDFLVSQDVADTTKRGKDFQKSKLKKTKSSTLGDFFSKANMSTRGVFPTGIGDAIGEALGGAPPPQPQKALPKNVREIDGVLWKVDADGNKIKKVRPKNSSHHSAATTTGHSASNMEEKRKRSASVGRTVSRIVGMKDSTDGPSDLNSAMQTIAELEQELKQKESLVSKFEKKTENCKSEYEKMKSRFQNASKEKRRLDDECKTMQQKLTEKESTLKVQRMELESKQREILEQMAKNNSSTNNSDHLMTQIKDLMAENDVLMNDLNGEKAQANMKLKSKDEELRFLQEELKRMRAEKGERDFGSGASVVGEPENAVSLMDNIFSQKKEQEDAAMKKQLEALQERVDSLQTNNEKLKKELEKATLTVNDDDDEELRKAKEMANMVKTHGLTQNSNAQATKDKMFFFKSMTGSSNTAEVSDGDDDNDESDVKSTTGNPNASWWGRTEKV